MPEDKNRLDTRSLEIGSQQKVYGLVKELKDVALPPTAEADGTDIYSQMHDALRAQNDAQFGISSSVETVDGEKAWLRDATAAPGGAATPAQEQLIQANNMRLRCLSRVRAIDHALSKKYPGDTRLRERIKTHFLKFTTGNDFSKGAEAAFDTGLIGILNQANLTQGVETKEDAEALLTYYRNLSSLVMPARPMITLSYDSGNGVLLRETQYPVTTKTDKQLAEMDALSDMTLYPLAKDKTAHTLGNLASQEADKLFVDLMKDNTRMLAAQARKTHLVGTKNAFIVKTELVFDVSEDNLNQKKKAKGEGDNVMWCARTGSPTYLGKEQKGEDGFERRKTHTKENLEQIRMAAKERTGEKLSLHMTILNTDMPHEGQDLIYRVVRSATENSSHQITSMPTNLPGTFYSPQVAPAFQDQVQTGGSTPLNQLRRVDLASKVARKAAQGKDYLSVIFCASGQDRTGTAVEKMKKDWMAERYETEQVKGSEEDRARSIASLCDKGFNAGEMTTHAVPTAAKMKLDSQPKKFGFSDPEMTAEQSGKLYGVDAKLNKKNPVSGKLLYLTNPSKLQVSEYEAQYERCKALVLDKEGQYNEQLKKQLQGILAQAHSLYQRGSMNSKSLSELSEVLTCCECAMKHEAQARTDEGPAMKDEASELQKKKVQKNLDRMAGVSAKLSSREPNSAWKRLGEALQSFVNTIASIFQINVTLDFSLVRDAEAPVVPEETKGVSSSTLASEVEKFKQVLESIENDKKKDGVPDKNAQSFHSAQGLVSDDDDDAQSFYSAEGSEEDRKDNSLTNG